jgi:hypothetical protein
VIEARPRQRHVEEEGGEVEERSVGGRGEQKEGRNLAAVPARAPLTGEGVARGHAAVGRCRLTVSKPVLKARMVSALEATIS